MVIFNVGKVAKSAFQGLPTNYLTIRKSLTHTFNSMLNFLEWHFNFWTCKDIT